MALKKYLYSGPVSGVTLQEAGKGKDSPVKQTDVVLQPGKEVTLPDDNQYVRDLVERGYLTAVANTKAGAAAGDGSPLEKEQK